MEDSPSTVGTIDEEKLDIHNIYAFESGLMGLPPPPPIFNNRQNSIHSNNSRDNEAYSIFSHSNTSYNSINDSYDSLDQFYQSSEYEWNQSFDSIPDSVVDPSASPYSFYSQFDSHGQAHGALAPGPATMSGGSGGGSGTGSGLPIGHAVADHHFGSVDNLYNTTGAVPYTPLHRFHSEAHLPRVGGNLTTRSASMSTPINTTISHHATPTANVSASSLTPSKPETSIPWATFRHNPPMPHGFFPSPRRRTIPHDEEALTPTTATTSASTANSAATSPLATSLTPTLHQHPYSQHSHPHSQHPHSQYLQSGAKKHTRRRLLPRSKNGCWICRIKHLKCNEARPTCSSCSRFGIACDYSSEKPLYVSDKTLRREKLLEITTIRKSNQKLRSKTSKRRLKE
ncbi:hypothetical protein CANTEDRAFT_132931 [Yamadazyma tenuis ATCC 10573]|uniref:Zn(2)-C6 fungal-type domain-containing protein n=1 Tax=Candida tenuis (strain ATCC 10573 / BCRC 21748 / CBS 615 / JCM 9827 / NBRC 10315 / NRRL Y-1498 / VKM Y-70) TaxID=590646 RepID=G3AX28_CANTC|nr:uncharacterized protein CANTEDRAFT_132931 [Yamadazyma tenuis ATCC 10573]EGV66675.1 hypothetical protein CANTEDRAFT_132931 [Yamadazyma tenuis ATCC 10573]